MLIIFHKEILTKLLFIYNTNSKKPATALTFERVFCMYICSRSHRRLNFYAKKREVAYQRELPEKRIEAEKNRDIAFERKHGKQTNKKLITQADYLTKLFAF